MIVSLLLAVLAAQSDADVEQQRSREIETAIRTLRKGRTPMVPITSFEALRRWKARDHAEALYQLVKDADPAVRVNGIAALGTVGATEYERPLIALLSSEPPEIREAVVFALAQLATPKAVSAVLSALKDDEPAVRIAALRGLARLGVKEHGGPVAALLADDATSAASGEIVFLTALDVLGTLQASEQAEAVAPFLKHAEADARTKAVEALGKLGARAHEKAVAAALKDPVPGVRAAAALALARLEAREQVPLIAELLAFEGASDGLPQFDPRSAALEALGRLGARDRIDAIAAHLKGSRRVQAAVALSRLGAREHAAQIAAMLDEGHNPDLIEALMRLRHPLPAKRIFEASAPACVLLEVRSASARGLGTGFFVRDDGLLLTNKHVVRMNGEAPLRLRARRYADLHPYEARLVAVHPTYDLALVRVDVGVPVPFLTFEEGTAAVGEDLVIIGHPMGFRWTLTSGKVSQLRSDGAGGRTAYLQTDGASNPGNSGGPVLNACNRVVGVLTMGLENAQGLNFAIYKDVAAEFVKTHAD